MARSPSAAKRTDLTDDFRTFIGIDPDLHTTGIAAIRDWKGERPFLLHASCIKSKGAKYGEAVLAMSAVIRDHWLKFSTSPPGYCVAFAVEGQEMYLGQTKNPRSIMYLAAAAGAALHECVAHYPAAYARFPRPQEWKGQVPKHVCQSRAFTKLGLPYKFKGNKEKDSAYCVPDIEEDTDKGKFNYGDWKHVGDAVALAWWVREQYIRMLRTRELRANRA